MKTEEKLHFFSLETHKKTGNLNFKKTRKTRRFRQRPHSSEQFRAGEKRGQTNLYGQKRTSKKIPAIGQALREFSLMPPRKVILAKN